MAKYIWTNAEYCRKNQIYWRVMLVFMAVTLILLWVLPENMKVVNFIPLVLAMICWIQSWRYHSKDQKLKASEKQKL